MNYYRAQKRRWHGKKPEKVQILMHWNLTKFS